MNDRRARGCIQEAHFHRGSVTEAAREPGAFAYDRCVFKFFGSSPSWPASPVPNSYWVEPGRLLAGEYPGAPRADAPSRIQALLAAGITSFIDLTGEGELPPYSHDLPDREVVHRRFPIIDHGVPDSPAVMSSVVAAIASDLEEGRRVYVHCRAGIGRTGMAVGCYLIQSGLDGDAALDKLQVLWQRCARARSWPSVPETEDQIRFVRSWAPGAQADAGQERRRGALMGLAVAEGLSLATVERRIADAEWIAESKRVEPLGGGSDLAQTLAVLESLMERDAHDSDDQLRRHVAWTQQRELQSRVPNELKRVLAVWQWSRKSNIGSHDPKNLDAHPLARSLAAALFVRDDVERAAGLAADIARTTLQSPVVVDACRLWAGTLTAALKGDSKPDLLAMRSAQLALRQREIKPPIATLLKGDWQRTEPVDGVLSQLASALDIFRFTRSFEVAVREAVRVGSTCSALVGSLAGAFYGLHSIPSEWQRATPESQRIRTIADQLLQ